MVKRGEEGEETAMIGGVRPRRGGVGRGRWATGLQGYRTTWAPRRRGRDERVGEEKIATLLGWAPRLCHRRVRNAGYCTQPGTEGTCCGCGGAGLIESFLLSFLAGFGDLGCT